jgi:hypothetical protein
MTTKTGEPRAKRGGKTSCALNDQEQSYASDNERERGQLIYPVPKPNLKEEIKQALLESLTIEVERRYRQSTGDEQIRVFIYFDGQLVAEG